MILNQISVFLENKAGALSAFMNPLAEHKIDIQAMTTAEALEYGIVRMIVDKTDEAVALMMNKGFSCKITPVLAVTVPDEPGSLAKLLQTLADHNISIGYSYAFFLRTVGHARIVIRVDDNEAAEKVLKEAGVIADA